MERYDPAADLAWLRPLALAVGAVTAVFISEVVSGVQDEATLMNRTEIGRLVTVTALV